MMMKIVLMKRTLASAPESLHLMMITKTLVHVERENPHLPFTAVTAEDHSKELLFLLLLVIQKTL